MTNAWAMIHRETGEIKELQSSANRDAGYHQHKSKERRAGRAIDFTNANMRYLHEVYDALTTAQCGYLMLLQCYVDYDDGTIINPDKTPMTAANMLAALQLKRKRSTYHDFMSACIACGFIIEAEDGSFAINRRYHFKGAMADTYAIKTYTAKVKRVYSEVKAADIGLIYRMLPLVHMSTNALCDNPFEKNPKKVRWLNRKELAEAIGVDPSTLGRRLPGMRFDGEYVVARIKLGSEPERYTMNPSVFYRQDNEPGGTLQAMFNV
ncbi:hypothetical protein [Sporosarcina psychrophila]|uniref:Replication protein n=1 Tax=Sporosarcina psychrophila TaxID=1476 RepID=A0ABV2KBQ7_SPOPS